LLETESEQIRCRDIKDYRIPEPVSVRLHRLASTGLHVLLLVLLAAVPARAEPEWLKQVVAEKAGLSTYPGASWVVLHKSKAVEIESDGRSESTVRIAAEILKHSAGPFAELRELLDFYREIVSFEGWIMLPQGGFEEMDESMIARAAAPGGRREHSEDQVLTTSLPRLRRGAVIAFEYRIRERGWPSFFQSFVFQYQQPVRFARFSLELPGGWKYHKTERRMAGVEYGEAAGRHTWTGRDLAYRPEEPLSPPWTYLARRLIISAFDPGSSDQGRFSDWNAVASWYAGLAAEAARPDDIIRQTTEHLVEGLESPAARVAAIASFVQTLRYAAVEFGQNKWQPRCASVTLHNRYGDCKDKTVLMQAMLDAAGLASVPVLTSLTLDVDEEFPNPLQFNHVLVGIPVVGIGELRVYSDAIAEGWLFFDPTAADVSLGGLSSALQGKTALICTPSGAHLVRLPALTPARTHLREYEIEAHLQKDGSVIADVKVTDRGCEAAHISRFRAVTQLEEQIETWKRRIFPSAPTLVISNFQYFPDPDSGWVRFRVELPGYVTGSDSLGLLKMDFLHPAFPPDLVPGSRNHPVQTGSRGITRADILWHLPPQWRNELEDASEFVASEGGKLRYRLTPLSAGSLRLSWEIELSGEAADPSGYDRAVLFSEALSDLHSLTILLRKTEVPE
jgi:hypothetical protein